MAHGLIGNTTSHSITFQEAITERLAENVEVFNNNSMGAINLSVSPSAVIPGLGSTETYFSRNATSGTSRRDITSTSTRTVIADANVAEKEAKVFGKVTPYGLSESAIRNLADQMGRSLDVDDYIRIRGFQVADDQMQQIVSSVLASLYGSILNVSGLQNDQSASSITANLVKDTLQKHGDQQQKMVVMLQHSAIDNSLVKAAVTANRYNEVAPVLAGQAPGTFGRMRLITDNSQLYSGSPAVYRTYMLARNAINVNLRWTIDPFWERESSVDNIPIVAYGEFEYSVRIPGFTYAGANNPTDAILDDQASWTQTAVQDKAINHSLLLSLV